MSGALYEQGLRSEGPQAADLLAQAVAACRSALEVHTREQLPLQWAGTEAALAIALREQGRRCEGAQAAGLLAQAVAACRNALQVYTREQFPQEWADTQDNLGCALTEQARRNPLRPT